jgi:large subunit ribosomal protein L31
VKANLHPDYKTAHILCACGNQFETRSVRGDFHVEICSNCHPYYTGKQKLIDTEGRVDRFRKKYAANAAKAAAPAQAKKA